MDEILSSYVEDLRDSLLLFNKTLMLFDQGVINDETINSVFRVAHTIKGNSAAMEFTKVEQVMHTMEDLLQEVRSNERELTPELISIQYRCHDFLEDFMEILMVDESDEKVEIAEILSQLNAIKDGSNIKPSTETQNDIKDNTEEFPTDFIISAFNNISSELVDVIDKNLDMGTHVYHINIKLNPDTPMISIRAFLIFQKIETHGMIVYSIPNNPSEEEFSNGDFNFSGEDLDVLVMGDMNAEEIIDDLSSDINISTMHYEQVSKEEMKKNIRNFNASKDLINAINSVEVDVLDIQQNQIKKENVSIILDNLKFIKNNNDSININILAKIAERLILILETLASKNKEFTPDNAVTFEQILQDMTFISTLYVPIEDLEIINRTEERLSLLEHDILGDDIKIGQILLNKGLINNDDEEQIVSKQKESGQKFGQVVVKEKKASPVDVSKALREQKTSSKPRKTNESDRIVRVHVSKIDNLMDMLGELIILNSQLELQVESAENVDPAILNSISRSSKIIRNVQDLSMSLRLIELKNTLFRLTRVIRDTANELGKKVNISITGEDTEIDRSAAEKLFDPLMHLVRNAVSHGVETPEERIAAGKDPEGKIEIKAYSKKGNIYIEVNDDGKGIDPEKVLKKAISVGLASEGVDYSESEIVEFIMKPGFSTQSEINNISGRGVGMNVVESELRKINGKIDINNNCGNGCSFILRIPMNLALINGTIVEIDDARYIIPTLFIKQFIVKPENEWISMQGKKRAIKIRDSIIPLILPEKIFGKSKESSKEKQQIVVLELDKKTLALPVDNIIGKQEIVAKPLGEEFASLKVISGAAILGDGKVSLILDVESILKLSGQ